jgi:Zn-dependent M28 family amino/carboxypeptidase
MTSPNLPSYPPPDKCQRPAQKFDLSKLPQDLFSEAPPIGIDAELKLTLDTADEENIIAWLKGLSLANFTTRHTASPLNLKAANWLKTELQTIGYTDVALHDFKYQGQTRHNVVATKRGKTDPDIFIIVCAHYDSRMENLDDHISVAPGADDNASGVATILELSTVLHQVATDCSIRFILFSGEEQGLLGSSAYAKHAHDSGMNIRLLINLDMVGHVTDGENPSIIIEIDSGNTSPVNDEPSRQFGKQMAAAAGAGLKTRFGPIYSSDYMPFEHFGYVCVGLFDGADGEPFYHTQNDTEDKVSTSLCLEIVKMLSIFVSQASKTTPA